MGRYVDRSVVGEPSEKQTARVKVRGAKKRASAMQSRQMATMKTRKVNDRFARPMKAPVIPRRALARSTSPIRRAKDAFAHSVNTVRSIWNK